MDTTIINVILILLLVDQILQLIFKPKHNVLGCGIMAWAGRSPKTFNEAKFNMLGIMNETRGTDSCGVSVDGDIYFGVDGTKRYRDFLAETNYPMPTKIPVVIGHTRKSTVGSHTIDNAHPFGFGDSKKTKAAFSFIGCHNGTLYNQKDLAHKYEIETSRTKSTTNNSTYTTDKIDSEILLEIIYSTKKFKVLSSYNGAAALVFYHVDEPDTLYVYHGHSVKRQGGADKTTYVERSLFGYQEHKNSLYISSQDHALLAIGANDDTLINFKTNIVYKIKNGNFKSAEEFPISRASQQHERMTTYDKKTKQNARAKVPVNGTSSSKNDSGGSKAPQIPFTRPAASTSVSSDSNIFNDKTHTIPSKKFYVENLRYKRNGHGLDGVYIWITGFGFHFIGFDIVNGEKTFWALVNKTFDKGDFLYNDKTERSTDAFVPFPEKLGYTKDIVNPLTHFHYFIEGVKIITHTDWKSAKHFQSGNNKYTMEALSNIAAHPICQVKRRKDDDKQGILYQGSLATISFCPVGSEKIYHIEKGNCVKIEATPSAKHRSPYSNLELITQQILDFEANFKEGDASDVDFQVKDSKVINLNANTENKNPTEVANLSSAMDEEVLTQLLDEIFLPTFDMMQLNKDRLYRYRDTPKGKEAIFIINELLSAASDLVMVEVNED